MKTTVFAMILAASNLAFAQGQTAPPAEQKAVAVPFIILRGTLVKGLNSKSATAGQTFVVKTAEPLKLSNGSEIPADSGVTGHVLQSEARGNGAKDSTLTLTFDTLQPKGSDKPLPIRGIIQAITGPAPVAAQGPQVGDMRSESVGGAASGARISQDQMRSDAKVGGERVELNERSSGAIGLKNTTLTVGPVNGVDGSMFYSADKSVKLEDGSQVMLRIALKR